MTQGVEPQSADETRVRGTFTRTRSIAALERLTAYVDTLSPGDRLIAYALGVGIVLTSLVSFYTLEQRLAVAVPAYGGTLTEGMVGSPRFIHPLLAISDADRDLTSLTYAGLMGLTADGSLEPVLAEKVEVSEDGKTYTFTLRENAYFSDGARVTADDVVFTIQKAQDPGIKSLEFANWSGVEASAIDARTITFTLPKPYAPFLENTTIGILPARHWRSISNEQFPFSVLTIEPVGAGPFKPGSIRRDKNGLISGYTLDANPRFVLGSPYLSRIAFTFFEREEDLTSALADGDIESAYGYTGTRSVTAPYARVFGVFFNQTGSALFARQEVRKALSTVIDRERIVSDVLGGYATALMGPVPPGSSVRPTAITQVEDRVRTAATILEKEGWKYDTDARLWKHAGAKLSLEDITIRTSNVPELKAVAGAVKLEWERLGLGVTIELYEPGDLNQNVIRPRNYDALLFGMVIGREQDLYAFWHSAERNDPGLNISLYANKTVDALLEQYRQSHDVAVRSANLQKIEDTIASEYPAAFTHAPDFVYAVPEKLKGIVLPQITTPSDRFAEVRRWHLGTELVWPFLVPKHL